MFRIGLLVVLVVTVKAHFEYDDTVNQQLPYFKILAAQTPALDFALKNSHDTVLWKRKVTPGKKDIRFNVVINKNLDATLRDTDDSPITTTQCEGRPWILATLQKNKNRFLKLIGVIKGEPTAFCLHGIHMSIIKRKTQPRVRLIVKFQESKTNEIIGVEMDVFKPPKHETDVVLEVASPIPLQEFRKPSLQLSEYNKQSFVSDIAWIENVLPRARFFKFTKVGKHKRYAEWYMAGPIIVQPEEFNKIIGLEQEFVNLDSNKRRRDTFENEDDEAESDIVSEQLS